LDPILVAPGVAFEEVALDDVVAVDVVEVTDAAAEFAGAEDAADGTEETTDDTAEDSAATDDSTDAATDDAATDDAATDEVSEGLQAANIVITIMSASKTMSTFFFMRKISFQIEAYTPLWKKIVAQIVKFLNIIFLLIIILLLLCIFIQDSWRTFTLNSFTICTIVQLNISYIIPYVSYT